MWRLSCFRSEGSGKFLKQCRCRSARRAAEDMTREHRHFDDRVDGGKVRNDQDGRDSDEVGRRDEPRNLRVDNAVGKLADDEENASGHNLIKRILNEGLEPSPKEPIQLRNDKERNKDWAKENAKGSRYDSERHNNERQSFGHDRPEPQ